MKGLSVMLKALGFNIAPEQIAMIEALVPQIPAKLNEAGTVINNAMRNFDQRLQALEKQNNETVAWLERRLNGLEQQLANLGEQNARRFGSTDTDSPKRPS